MINVLISVKMNNSNLLMININKLIMIIYFNLYNFMIIYNKMILIIMYFKLIKMNKCKLIISFYILNNYKLMLILLINN